MEPIQLSVRTFVEFILRSGDLDSRFVDSSSMLDGARIHRRIQKEMPKEYKSEVPLQVKADIEGVTLVLSGRADGILTDSQGKITIDEIKSTTLSLERLYEQQSTLHFAQAKCYAYMLLQSMEEPPEELVVQLTYYQIDTEELRRYQEECSREEITAFFHGLLIQYGVWLRFGQEWKRLRDASARAAEFPYPKYRKGQRELAVHVYRAIEAKKKLYAQAPTGIGKTLSTLFPTIKAMGEGKTEKIFYLTAKTVTRGVAEDAVRFMGSQGLRLKTVTLRAKNKICFCEEPVCTPDHCPYAKGHYDRVNDAVMDLLQHHDLITPEVVEEVAQAHQVCPFELSLDTAVWADAVICDYNHVFDPVVYLRRFFGEDGGNYVFLIDEAHNLADRVRDMYSLEIRKSVFSEMKKQLKDQNPPAAKLRKAAEKVIRHLREMKKACGEEKSKVDREQDQTLAARISAFGTAAEEWLAAERGRGHRLEQEVLGVYFETRTFLILSQLYDDHFTTITELYGSDVAVTLFCLDPSLLIGQRLGQAAASVLFSATLTPLSYYREILGGTEEDRTAVLPSPFDADRLLLMAHDGISTKYHDREESYAPICRLIHSMVMKRRGNYMAFFPSYEYMNRVYELFTHTYPSLHTAMQESDMAEDQRAEFLSRFDDQGEEGLLGFCTLGGIFSEGIDLKGERLIGSIIVGVGLPRLSLRQNLLKDYFNPKNGSGYEYAYVYPGMNKVLQAAGRVIRSETDCGVVLLIDSRFGTSGYQQLYPAHWSHLRRIKSEKELLAALNGFSFFKM